MDGKCSVLLNDCNLNVYSKKFSFSLTYIAGLIEVRSSER